jgi:hypothetical protein
MVVRIQAVLYIYIHHVHIELGIPHMANCLDATLYDKACIEFT